MRFLRFVSLALTLALLPNLMQASTGDAPSQGSQGCKRSFLSQPAVNQSVATPVNLSMGGGSTAEVSPYCAQFACPGAHPTFACRCACDVEECDCTENCARGNFFCKQQCRNQLNNCYLSC